MSAANIGYRSARQLAFIKKKIHDPATKIIKMIPHVRQENGPKFSES